MSKQLSGSLFVDIQGNNKGLKKSLNQSKRDVNTFSTQVSSQLAGIPLIGPHIGAALAAGGAAFGAVRGRQAFSNFKQRSQATTGALLSRKMSRGRIQDLNQTSGLGLAGEEGGQAALQASIDRNKANLNRGRRAAAKDRLALRNVRRAQNSKMFAAKQTMSAMGSGAVAFLSTGVGLVAAAGAVGAILGVIGLDIKKRVSESKAFSGAQLKEDALTKVARIKQNIQIAKSTGGQGFAGAAARFRDKQSASAAPFWGTVGNIIGGATDAYLGWMAWMAPGNWGPAGGAYRWATGGDFF